MQRIINDPRMVVEDMLKGYLKAHGATVAPTDNPRVLRYRDAPIEGKVGLVTGGGSGHEPAFLGYLGRGMLDAVAIGEVFSSPSATAFHAAFQAADSGHGVVCLYGNYAGDNMNVRIAVKLAAADGIEVATVVANDDVPSAALTERMKRRGVAGEVLLWKIAGASAAAGSSVDEVVRVAQHAIDQTRSIGIGLAPCAIPAVGKPNFSIEPGTMEVGIGHHGEPGVAVEALLPAKEIAARMVETILPDLPFVPGDDVIALVSGLGATPLMELYILYGEVADLLARSGIHVHRPYVGNYFTSLEMTGVTLTLLRLDDELTDLIDRDAASVGLVQVGR
ncbi:MAG: dihydroxyacetone kinase subunit DhaK [Chloroflexota bacterium]